MSPGILYLIATPIGNLDDFTHRAASVLGEVDVIICEDTRHTRKLLGRYDIRRPMEAYHDFNETDKAETLIERLTSGQTLALVSDAGTPTVSDPGYRLVRLCRQQNIPVIPIPGPSAAVTALSVSGLPTDEFLFAGFLPSRKEARRRRIESLKLVACTLVFYEAPRRIASTLKDMQEILGDREVFVGARNDKTARRVRLWKTQRSRTTDEAAGRGGYRSRGGGEDRIETARRGSADDLAAGTAEDRGPTSGCDPEAVVRSLVQED